MHVAKFHFPWRDLHGRDHSWRHGHPLTCCNSQQLTKKGIWMLLPSIDSVGVGDGRDWKISSTGSRGVINGMVKHGAIAASSRQDFFLIPLPPSSRCSLINDGHFHDNLRKTIFIFTIIFSILDELKKKVLLVQDQIYQALLFLVTISGTRWSTTFQASCALVREQRYSSIGDHGSNRCFAILVNRLVFRFLIPSVLNFFDGIVAQLANFEYLYSLVEGNDWKLLLSIDDLTVCNGAPRMRGCWSARCSWDARGAQSACPLSHLDARRRGATHLVWLMWEQRKEDGKIRWLMTEWLSSFVESSEMIYCES